MSTHDSEAVTFAGIGTTTNVTGLFVSGLPFASVAEIWKLVVGVKGAVNVNVNVVDGPVDGLKLEMPVPTLLVGVPKLLARPVVLPALFDTLIVHDTTSPTRTGECPSVSTHDSVDATVGIPTTTNVAGL